MTNKTTIGYIAKLMVNIFAFIGLCTVVYFLAFQDTYEIDSKHIKNKKIILKQLLKLSNHPVLVDNCENFQELEEARVYDFLSGYLNLTIFTKDIVQYTSIKCDEREMGECSFSYGGKAEEDKGWSDILFFEYDNKTRKVNPKSFECLSL
ncbi:MAG TPA: hypothetical protein EYG83_06825 [Sulfurospirillum arcachonense]|nr:hypothetical protein [Sulfurospirillum arcachonense]